MAKRGRVTKSQEKDTIERPIRYKRYQNFFLIVCEDINTEPYYFSQFIKEFPEGTLFLKPVGTGFSPKGVVEQAIKEREKLKDLALKDIDSTWAVFDKDDADENETKINNFNEAFSIAEEQSINLAYSNEVFELWLLLHFKDVNIENPIPRTEIYSKLHAAICESPEYENFIYRHGKPEVIDIIRKIGNEQRAIERAENIYQKQNDKHPLEANPITKVHFLIKELREWIVYYNYQP